jgi:hypothetical protein
LTLLLLISKLCASRLKRPSLDKLNYALHCHFNIPSPFPNNSAKRNFVRLLGPMMSSGPYADQHTYKRASVSPQFLARGTQVVISNLSTLSLLFDSPSSSA